MNATKFVLGLLALLSGALCALPTVASGAPAVPLERVIYRDVRGLVVDAETGQPVAGAVVSLLYEMTVSDSQGGFVFEKIPLTHSAEVSVRVRTRSGIVIGCVTLDVPVHFFPLAANVEEIVEVGAPDGSGKRVKKVITKTAITVIDPASEEPVVLNLRTLPPDQLSRYCGQCHDVNPCLETSAYEEVVKSGKDLRGILVYEDELNVFKEELQKQGLKRDSYRKMRYQDTHPDGMNMVIIPELQLPQYKGRYVYPQGLDLLDDKYVTCATCHTRHVPTEMKQYVVESYEEDNKLCFRCHL